MDYKKKYLKYKKKYLNLSGGGSETSNETKSSTSKKKGLAIIFIPDLIDDFFYSDAFYIYDMCSKLDIFDNDRVYILGDNRFENLTKYDKVKESFDENKLPGKLLDLTLRTPSKNVNRYLGNFTYENINKIHKIINSSNPDIIHYYFVTHGNKHGMTMCNSRFINDELILEQLILHPNINIPNRKLFFYTASCYGGQMIESIKKKLVLFDRYKLYLELYLISEVYDASASSFFKIDSNIGNGKILNSFILDKINDPSFKFIDIFGPNTILRKYGNITYSKTKSIEFIENVIAYISNLRGLESRTNASGITRNLLQQPINIVTEPLFNFIWDRDGSLLIKILKFLLQNWDSYKNKEDEMSLTKKILLIFLLKFQKEEFTNISDMLNSTINKVIEYSLDEYFIDRDSLNIIFDDITTNEMIINLSAIKLSEICYNIKDIKNKNLKLYFKLFYDIFKYDGFKMLSYNYQVYPEGIENTQLRDIFGTVKV